MKTNRTKVPIYFFFVAVFLMLFYSQSVAAEKLKSDRSAKAAPFIMDIALDSLDTPFYWIMRVMSGHLKNRLTAKG